MKSFQIAVVLLVIFIGALEALRCNHCVPSRPGGHCSKSEETCTRREDVCASVISTAPVYSYFRRCMKASDAFILKASQYFQVFTCTTDLCN